MAYAVLRPFVLDGDMKLAQVRASRFRQCLLEENARRLSPPRFVVNFKCANSVAFGEPKEHIQIGGVHVANKALKHNLQLRTRLWLFPLPRP